MGSDGLALGWEILLQSIVVHLLGNYHAEPCYIRPTPC